jgi:Flp pilus assembly protein TadG
MRYRSSKRRGAVAVESAIVYSLLFLLLFGLIVGGVGVFRYQQVACQAREASRWACVRGADWQKETGNPAPTQEQIRQAAVLPLAAGMDPDQLTIKVEWINRFTGKVYDWDEAPRWTVSTTTTGEAVTNTVRVTVSYAWSPSALLPGTLTLRSVSEVPMAF